MGLAESIQFYSKTDVGRVRDLNEDNFLVDKKLALSIVADGMGGHAAGEVASAIAVRVIHQEMRKRYDLIRAYGTGQATRDGAREIQSVMESAVLRACSRVHEEAKADASKRGMGTTLSSLMVTGSHGFVAHVGDSRIYLYRDGKIQQITEDHTVFNELIRRGRLTREQIEKVAQKNAVTRAVGVYERVDVDTLMLELLPGDQFLLASDGLHGYINHVAELEPFFEDDDGERASSELIELANKKGGKDNITCVLVRIGRADQKDAERARRLALQREALRNMPLFSKLQERELLRVMQVAEVVEFEAGQDVVREGDRGDELFIVVDGVLQIMRGEQILSEVGPGEHFGEMALIRATPRSATVRAVERAELLQIRRGDFFSIVRKEYELAVKLLWQFLGVLADRLDQTSRDLSTAKEELAAEDISDAIAEDEDEAAAAASRSGERARESSPDARSAKIAKSDAREAPRSITNPYAETMPSVSSDVRSALRSKLAPLASAKPAAAPEGDAPVSVTRPASVPDLNAQAAALLEARGPSSLDPSSLEPPPSAALPAPAAGAPTDGTPDEP
ncbi:MAG: Stp1/IreP family PP2C-type Ser/Thr phosphatase [Polyangiaceae bacterium]